VKSRCVAIDSSGLRASRSELRVNVHAGALDVEGFTLIEVLIALVVLAFGMLSLVR